MDNLNFYGIRNFALSTFHIFSPLINEYAKSNFVPSIACN